MTNGENSVNGENGVNGHTPIDQSDPSTQPPVKTKKIRVTYEEYRIISNLLILHMRQSKEADKGAAVSSKPLYSGHLWGTIKCGPLLTEGLFSTQTVYLAWPLYLG